MNKNISITKHYSHKRARSTSSWRVYRSISGHSRVRSRSSDLKRPRSVHRPQGQSQLGPQPQGVLCKHKFIALQVQLWMRPLYSLTDPDDLHNFSEESTRSELPGSFLTNSRILFSFMEEEDSSAMKDFRRMSTRDQSSEEVSESWSNSPEDSKPSLIQLERRAPLLESVRINSESSTQDQMDNTCLSLLSYE